MRLTINVDNNGQMQFDDERLKDRKIEMTGIYVDLLNDAHDPGQMNVDIVFLHNQKEFDVGEMSLLVQGEAGKLLVWRNDIIGAYKKLWSKAFKETDKTPKARASLVKDIMSQTGGLAKCIGIDDAGKDVLQETINEIAQASFGELPNKEMFYAALDAGQYVEGNFSFKSCKEDVNIGRIIEKYDQLMDSSVPQKNKTITVKETQDASRRYSPHIYTERTWQFKGDEKPRPVKRKEYPTNVGLHAVELAYAEMLEWAQKYEDAQKAIPEKAKIEKSGIKQYAEQNLLDAVDDYNKAVAICPVIGYKTVIFDPDHDAQDHVDGFSFLSELPRYEVLASELIKWQEVSKSKPLSKEEKDAVAQKAAVTSALIKEYPLTNFGAPRDTEILIDGVMFDRRQEITSVTLKDASSEKMISAELDYKTASVKTYENGKWSKTKSVKINTDQDLREQLFALQSDYLKASIYHELHEIAQEKGVPKDDLENLIRLSEENGLWLSAFIENDENVSKDSAAEPEKVSRDALAGPFLYATEALFDVKDVAKAVAMGQMAKDRKLKEMDREDYEEIREKVTGIPRTKNYDTKQTGRTAVKKARSATYEPER